MHEGCRAHGLHGHVVLVEGLEYDVGLCRDEEVCRAVGLDGHHAVLDLEAHGYQQILSVEALVRSWHVTRRSVRPDHRMVAHTGFIITGRRTAVRPSDTPDEG